MSEHRSWSEFAASLDPEVTGYWAEHQTAYIQGYILALEDVLKDYNHLELDPDKDYLDQLMQKVQESLDSARRTLEKLL